MKNGDIKYVIDIDVKHPFIYQAVAIIPKHQWKDNWRFKLTKKIFDFLHQYHETLEGVEGIYDISNHAFDTVEEAIHAITSSEWGMKEKAMMMRLFK